jgi:phage protein D
MAGTNGTANTLYAARPTINVGGKDVADLAQALVELVVAEDTVGLYRCEATFANWGTKNGRTDFLYFDRATLDFGKALQVKIGTVVIFDGRIMALEGHYYEGRPPELTVLAEDRLQDLRMTRRTRSFADQSDADVVRQVANEQGLSPDVDLPGPTHKVLAQVNKSDLAFLRERARAIDGEVWAEGGTLRARAHANRSAGTVTLTYSDNLREFSVTADLAGQRTQVSVGGWDVSAKDAIRHDADDSVLGAELNGDASGASVLKSALGERKESLAHTAPLTAEEAKLRAEAFFRMAARRFVVGRGVAEPNASLRVGARVDLKGLGPLFSGKYYLTEVKHLFDGVRGLRTEFTGERPGLGR